MQSEVTYGCYLYPIIGQHTTVFVSLLQRLLHIMNKQQTTTREKNPTGSILLYFYLCQLLCEKLE